MTKPKFRVGDTGYLFDPMIYLADPLNRPSSSYRAVKIMGQVRRSWLIEIDGLPKRVPKHKVLKKREVDAKFQPEVLPMEYLDV